MAEAKKKKRSLDDITLTVHKAFEKKYDSDGKEKPEISREAITIWLGKQGYTPESWHNAAMRRNEQLVKQARNPLARAVTGYADELINGMTFGVHNHVLALTRALLSDATYDEALADVRATEEQYRKAQPVASTIGNVAGSVLSSAGAANLVFKAAPRLAPVVGEPLRNLGRSFVTESGLGASEAAATALTAGAAADQIGGSAVLGGTLGLLSPLFSRGISKVSDFFSSSPKARAVGKLEQKIEDDFDTPDAIRARAKEFEDVGMADEPNIAYLGGPNVQQQSKTAALIPGPTLAKTQRQNLADQEANRQLTEDALVEGLGYANQGSDALRAAIVKNMKSKAEPLYEMAWKTPAFPDPRIDELMKLPRFKAAYTQAVENAKYAEKGKQLPPYPLKKPKKVKKGQPPPPPAKWTLYGLHQTKIALDEMIGGLQSNPTSRRNLLAKNLTERKNELLDLMDIASDEYGQARLIWSTDKKSLEAFNLGGGAYKATKTADQIKTELAGLETDAEKQLYRIGAATQAKTAMDIDTAQTKNYARKLLSPEMKEKHQILFPDEYLGKDFGNKLERISQIHEGAAATTPRSDTAGNLVGIEDVAANLADVGPGYLRKNYSGLKELARKHLAKQRDIATNTELGGLLRNKGAAHIEETMDAVKALPLQRAETLRNRGLISATGVGLVAQQLGERRRPKSLIR